MLFLPLLALKVLEATCSRARDGLFCGNLDKSPESLYRRENEGQHGAREYVQFLFRIPSISYIQYNTVSQKSQISDFYLAVFLGRLFMSEAKVCGKTVIPIFWLWGFSVERT